MSYQAVYFDWDGGEPNDAGANNTPEEQVHIFNNLFVVLLYISGWKLCSHWHSWTQQWYIFCDKKVLSPTMFFTQQWYIFCWKKSYISPYFSPVGKWNDFPCHCVDQCKIGNTPKYLRNCNNHNIKIKIKKYIQNWSHKFFAFWFSFLWNPNKWACLDSLVDSKASGDLQIIPDICQFRVNLGL